MFGRPSGELLVASMSPLVSGLRKVDVMLAHLPTDLSVEDLRFPHGRFHCRVQKEAGRSKLEIHRSVASPFAPFVSIYS
jgi:hypothetical protein